jgi:putative membrane protein
MKIVLRLIASAVALWVASVVVPGIVVTASGTRDRALTLLGVAVVFGLVNAVVKPVVKVIAFPAYLLTLGLFTFVANGLLLWLTGTLSQHLGLEFAVRGFVAGLLGAIVVSVVSFCIDLLVGD